MNAEALSYQLDGRDPSADGMSLAPEGLEERRPVGRRVVVAADLVEALQRALLSRREPIACAGTEAEGGSQRSQKGLPEVRPVPGIAEGVCQLDVVDELVAVDPHQVLDDDAGSVEHREPSR